MPYVRVDVDGEEFAVELDCEGRIVGTVNGPVVTPVADLPIILVNALYAKVWIIRERVILPDNRPHTYLRGRIDGRECTGRTIEDLCATFAAGAESVDYVENPNSEALRASIILAGDKGIPNHIEKNDYAGCDVVTDDGRRFQFRKK
jgi:hypothetical protein